MYAYEIYEQSRPNVVVTYPGRFQPFHLGHSGVFEILQKTFGRDSVYILTSNDTSSAKSPFNFNDKYQLMTAAGVPGDRIIETNKMYKLPDQFDPANTIFITVVGGPDADRLAPDTYTKKDQVDKATGQVTKPAGSPTYYKTWNSKEEPVTADKHGYVQIIPELKKYIVIDNENYDVSHGTDARNLWNKIRDDEFKRSQFLSQMYKHPHKELGTIFDKIPLSTNEDIAADSNDTASPISGRKVVESSKDELNNLHYLMTKFLPLAMKFLKLKSLPKMKIRQQLPDAIQASFGRFDEKSNTIFLAIQNRHPVDVLRTLAHELVHFKQHTENRIKRDSGRTGSPEENEANQYAGILLRIFNKKFPEGIQGQIISETISTEDQHPNDKPRGPEFKPTMPKGTVRVDVSDVYDWYKLGQHISDMKGLGKHDFGKGPPSTVLSFGDEDTEHKYIADLEKTGLTTTDIDPVDPKQPKGMKRQKVDPTFNVNENYKRRLVKSK